jgi:ATP-dependent RNA helicase RhlE
LSSLSRFADFGLLPTILDALIREGYDTPTPIQAQAIPQVLAGRDLCGIAQTGTGKTAAFALPILQHFAQQPAARTRGTCRALVLSPTRELASQIAQSFKSYGGRLPLSTAVIFGGVPLGPQQRQLASGVDILVATPGRLLDLIDRRALSLSGVQILVLDEADRMLDLGFIHALKRIVKLLPRQRQTLLFSATMPRTIAALSEEYLNDPVKVVVTPPATTVERVDQAVTFVPSERKRELLATLLRGQNFERVLVFTRTKHGADRVVRHLSQAGIDSAAIHGNKSQPQRERALAGFRAGRTRVLVATDIASRGIDVEAVSHVVNFELPNVPEDYVHRIGRTARAGAGGNAISFCSDEERPYLRDIEKLTRVPIAVIAAPSAMRLAANGSAGRAPEHSSPPPRHASPGQARTGRQAQAAPRPKHASNGTSRHNAPAAADPLPAFLRRRPQGNPRNNPRGNSPGRSTLQPVRS